MDSIIILTPTYNHCEHLNELYHSLLRQDKKNFEWLIVDDGSNDTTEQYCLKFMENSTFNINYIRKENGGKSSALNKGFDFLRDNSYKNIFVLIVDDDEKLYEDAITLLYSKYEEYLNTDISCIQFMRNDQCDNPITKIDIKNDIFEKVVSYKKMGIAFDGYVGYFFEKIKDVRIPMFDEEKYFSPSAFLMIVDKNSRTVVTNISLGKTEYLLGGITSQGRSLRLKNPKGMIVYCLLLQQKEAGKKINIIYSISGYGYYFYSKMKKEQLKELYHDYEQSFKWYCVFFGFLLCIHWRIKYK